MENKTQAFTIYKFQWINKTISELGLNFKTDGNRMIISSDETDKEGRRNIFYSFDTVQEIESFLVGMKAGTNLNKIMMLKVLELY